MIYHSCPTPKIYPIMLILMSNMGYLNQIIQNLNDSKWVTQPKSISDSDIVGTEGRGQINAKSEKIQSFGSPKFQASNLGLSLLYSFVLVWFAGIDLQKCRKSQHCTQKETKFQHNPTVETESHGTPITSESPNEHANREGQRCDGRRQ